MKKTIYNILFEEYQRKMGNEISGHWLCGTYAHDTGEMDFEFKCFSQLIENLKVLGWDYKGGDKFSLMIQADVCVPVKEAEMIGIY